VAEQSLERRMDMLERGVEPLEQLPERITALESQFVQLRDEMRAEFSTVRSEVRAGDEGTQRTLGDEIRIGDEETRRVLRDEIRAGDEETRRYMRVLHEDLVTRITMLGDGR
jgi:predicted phage gp36 major capsid-like protein